MVSLVLMLKKAMTKCVNCMHWENNFWCLCRFGRKTNVVKEEKTNASGFAPMFASHEWKNCHKMLEKFWRLCIFVSFALSFCRSNFLYCHHNDHIQRIHQIDDKTGSNTPEQDEQQNDDKINKENADYRTGTRLIKWPSVWICYAKYPIGFSGFGKKKKKQQWIHSNLYTVSKIKTRQRQHSY